MARRTVVRSTHRGTLAKAAKLKSIRTFKAAKILKSELMVGTSRGKEGRLGIAHQPTGQHRSVLDARTMSASVIRARPASRGTQIKGAKAIAKMSDRRYSGPYGGHARASNLTDTRIRSRRAGFLKSKGGATGRRGTVRRSVGGGKGFSGLVAQLASKGARNPQGLAAWIGRKKYGAAGMAAKAAAGRRKR